MHVTLCLAGQDDVDVEVGEECHSLQALKEAIVVALPQLCVEGFDVSVGGRALDDDEGVVSLVDSVTLDVVPNTRGLSALALREAGREVSEDGLFDAAEAGDVSLVTLYLDAGVPIDSASWLSDSPLHMSCNNGHLPLATLLLNRGSRAIDERNSQGETPLHLSCVNGSLSLVKLLLDRGSTAIDEKVDFGLTPLHLACSNGHVSIATLLLDRGASIDEKTDFAYHTPLHISCICGDLSLATLLLDRGSRAIDERSRHNHTPLHLSCCHGHVSLIRLLLDRGCDFDVEEYKSKVDDHEGGYTQEVVQLLSERGHAVRTLADEASLAKRRRTGEQ